MPVYQFDPSPAPDSDFLAGRLTYLVVGNRGRLLDGRRTPVAVTGVSPDDGVFEVEILGFEDAGSRWELGLEEVTRFQFARGAAMAPPDVERELCAAKQRFDVDLVIEADPAAYAQTAAAIEVERGLIRDSLALVDALGDVDFDAHVGRREGPSPIIAEVEQWLTHRRLLDVDQRFADAFVTNPRSGELVKGHAVVLAELGLCRYRGKVIRDPLAFESLSKPRRAEHIIVRLALMRELYARLARETLTVFRAAAVEGPFPAPSRQSFISATFSREVADEHFAGGANTQTAVIWRQQISRDRLFMTFLETAALNRQFKEAEAILIAEPENRAF